MSHGCTTDDGGRFSINLRRAGRYRLQATQIGYSLINTSFEVTHSIDLGALVMTQRATLLEAVQITSERPLYSVNREKVVRQTADDPLTRSDVSVDALRQTPDVEVDARGNVSFHGSSNVKIWINGQPSTLDAQSLRQYLNSMPASAISRIETITNPSVRYAVAGSDEVINIGINITVECEQLLILCADDDYTTGNHQLAKAYDNKQEACCGRFFSDFSNVGLTIYFQSYSGAHGTLRDIATAAASIASWL